MAGKTKKSLPVTFSENNNAIINAANEVLTDLESLSIEARYMVDENPESKGNIALWNCLVDIEDLVTTLSEGKTLSEKEAVSLGEACVEAVQYFNRSEEVSKNEVIAVFSKLNNLVFKNDLFA